MNQSIRTRVILMFFPSLFHLILLQSAQARLGKPIPHDKIIDPNSPSQTLSSIVLKHGLQKSISTSTVRGLSSIFASAFDGNPAQVVGGMPVKDRNRYPYMVSLLETDPDSPQSAIFNCGGTLIAPDVVLTAAHCVDDPRPKRYVQLGRYDFKDDENVGTYEVNQVFLCPDWNVLTAILDCDVALLKLSSYSSESPVLLQRDALERSPSQTVTAMGWGRTSEKGMAKSVVLREVGLNLVTKEQCKKYYGNKITDTMVCAFAYEKSSCHGDSGGPLFVKSATANLDVQLGVVSWGVTCAGDKPVVYTDLTSTRVLDFLDETMCNKGLLPSSCKDGKFLQEHSGASNKPHSTEPGTDLCKNVDTTISWWTCDHVSQIPSHLCRYFSAACPEVCCPKSCDPTRGCL